MSGDDTRYRRASLWLDLIDEPLAPRPSFPGPTDVDVAIVGAGYTGLWTAYYLKKADPTLRIAVDREGDRRLRRFRPQRRLRARPSSPRSLDKIARKHGRDGAWRCSARCTPPSTRSARCGGRGHRRAIPQGRLPQPRHRPGAGRAHPRAGRPLPRLGLHRRRDALARAGRGARAAGGRGLPRRHADSRVRRARPGAPGARAGARGRWARRAHLRADRDAAHRARPGRVTAAGDGARRGGGARPRGLHARLPGPDREMLPLYT